jgi:hypothetical protein
MSTLDTKDYRLIGQLAPELSLTQVPKIKTMR